MKSKYQKALEEAYKQIYLSENTEARVNPAIKNVCITREGVVTYHKDGLPVEQEKLIDKSKPLDYLDAWGELEDKCFDIAGELGQTEEQEFTEFVTIKDEIWNEAEIYLDEMHKSAHKSAQWFFWFGEEESINVSCIDEHTVAKNRLNKELATDDELGIRDLFDNI